MMSVEFVIEEAKAVAVGLVVVLVEMLVEGLAEGLRVGLREVLRVVLALAEVERVKNMVGVRTVMVAYAEREVVWEEVVEVDWEGVRDTEGVIEGGNEDKEVSVAHSELVPLGAKLDVTVGERECTVIVARTERDALGVEEKDSVGLPLREGLIEVLAVSVGVNVLDFVPWALMVYVAVGD